MSDDGFAVHYPRNWVRVGTDNGGTGSRTRLDIVIGLPRVSGVVIGSGQAQIIVSRLEDGHSSAELESVLRGRLPDEARVASSNVEGTALPSCNDPAETITRVEEGPGAFQYYVRLVCRADGARFLTLLRYWIDDSRADEYRRIARSITESVRLRR